MFNTATYAFIDGVSDFKKKFVETTVQHEGIKNALNGFVDAQTKYTKSAADAGMQSAMALGLIFSSKEFYSQIADQYKAMVPAFNTTKAKAK
jgi:uridine phosphorylase